MEKLELKHVAGYLPHELKCVKWSEEDINTENISKVTGIEYRTITDDFWIIKDSDRHESGCVIEYLIPYLRPLSDMTQQDLINAGYEDWEIDLYWIHEQSECLNLPYPIVEYMFSKHFDVFGLIEKGLAIDINTI